MGRFKLYKTIQLVACIIIAAVGVFLLVSDKEMFHMVANDPKVKALCIVLWAVLAVEFLFIFLDFSFFTRNSKHMNELDHAVHSDPTSGLANRYSCDMIIEKYLDRPLPDNIGCIMFDLVNIQDINRQHGHIIGNEVIREFSNILLASSADLCFVGRNGGNKFMALFEGYTDDKVNTFLTKVFQNVVKHNAVPNTVSIEYKYGIALAKSSSAAMITDLIAESNRKIYELGEKEVKVEEIKVHSEKIDAPDMVKTEE